MKPSIWTDAFVELELEQALEKLAGVGWRTLEVAEAHWRRIGEREDPERACEAVRRRADDLGVAFAQLHGYSFDFCNPDADTAAGLETTIRSLNYAAILGVGQYVLHTSSRPWGEEPGGYDQVRALNRDIVGRLAETARSLGVGIAVENTWDHPHPRRRFGTTAEELLWLVEQTDPEVVGVCWDTGHAHIAGLDQPRAIRALAPALRALHIQDSDGTHDQHRLPYEGTIAWEPLLRALGEVGYDGAFNLEVGGSVHRVPLPLRPTRLRFALELATRMVAEAMTYRKEKK